VVSILPLREAVLFPQAVVPLTAGREASLRLVEDLARSARLVGVFAQRDPGVEEPGESDLHRIGVLASVHRIVKQPDGTVRLIVQGVERIRIESVVQVKPYVRARIAPVADIAMPAGDLEAQALARNAESLFRRVIDLSPQLPDELAALVQSVGDPGTFADVVAATLPLQPAVKQELLETVDVKVRLGRLVAALTKELEILELGSKLQSQVESEMGKSQREYFLREQLKAIRKELGEGDERTEELDDLREKLEAAGLPDEAKKEALRELGRLAKIPPAAAEYTVARTYVEWLAALPWSKETEDTLDLARARTILDEDHSGLEKIKERILEYLAVKRMRPAGGRDPILCFVGPPGVGKTSLGKSIARALGRSFQRISLGGMRDEAEIRGHRRTYIGALPGQIIQALRRAGSKNPVLVLDEVDKIGADFRGDPAAALLEVLDPEQNSTFRDHYVDVPFDLSRVLFITTANLLDTVPAPLRDRMEIIELAGYTEEEKVRIARSHLVPKQARDHGLTLGEHLRWTDAALQHLARGYTREAGLRNLEREIATVTRKLARRRAEGEAAPVEVTAALVTELLGAPRFVLEELEDRTRVPGVAVGMAWTPAGGDILFVEASRMRGGKTLTLTGQLGDVMKESVQAALSWVRANAVDLGVRHDFWQTSDVHVHVPAGAIPKDGPSAGVTMVTALASLLTQRPVRPRLAMTGEVTLSGRVLPVGGIKEKVLAAKRAGVTTVILPARNEKHLLEDVPREARESMTFHLVDSVRQVLEVALEAAPAATSRLAEELVASPN
jgi:ATP-dependent Lon protease